MNNQPDQWIIKECKRCGAPLRRSEKSNESEMVCDYCGARYAIPEQYRQRQPPEAPAKPVYEPPPPATVIEPPVYPAKRNSNAGCIFGLLLTVCALAAGFLFFMFFMPAGLSTLTGGVKSTNPTAQTELSMYRRNSSALPDENPASFIHEETFSYGLVYNGGDNKDFNLHLMVMNKQDLAVSQNSKADRMQLESVAVTDNNGTTYQCEVSETSNQNLQPNQAASLARLSCQPILSPDVKFLQVKTQLTNWGAREFQIPITLDMDKLDVRYQVDRRADSAVLDISFYAKEPQNVELYYADISLLDGKGSRISMEPCRPGGAWFGETGPNFSTLAQSYQHGKDLTCEIPQAIGEDVNAITLVMTIRGKTVSLTTPVDTLSGTIKYGPED